jgi:hypothetical protein
MRNRCGQAPSAMTSMTVLLLRSSRNSAGREPGHSQSRCSTTQRPGTRTATRSKRSRSFFAPRFRVGRAGLSRALPRTPAATHSRVAFRPTHSGRTGARCGGGARLRLVVRASSLPARARGMGDCGRLLFPPDLALRGWPLHRRCSRAGAWSATACSNRST